MAISKAQIQEKKCIEDYDFGHKGYGSRSLSFISLILYFLFFFLVLDETGSHYVNQAGLTLLILLPQSPSLGFTEYTIMWRSDSAF